MTENEHRADSLGDRMKSYESVEAQRRLDPMLPVMIRLDGRSFHAFARGLERPFDAGLSGLMSELTAACVDETNAVVGYTQSDEISLVLHAIPPSQLYFGGRVQKVVSSLAAFASVRFNRLLSKYLPQKGGVEPAFDARAWTVPSLEEAANCILWREWDATKNAISMAAHARFSPRSLQGVDGRGRLAMLAASGVDFEAYPAEFRRGVFVRRVVTSAPFTAAEIESLPPMHKARRDPALAVTRSRIERGTLPPLAKIANRVEVLFENAEPRFLGEDPA